MKKSLSHTDTGEEKPGLVSIVVPTYKEAENLRRLVTGIGDAMSPVMRRYEIIVVDDNSGDGTGEIIRELLAEGHPVRLIARIGQRGLSSAVVCGFQEAKGDVLVCMDADLSHPPAAIPQLLNCLDDPEVDFVLGSRYVPGGSTDQSWGFLHRLNSSVATLMARPFTKVRDPMSGFFAIPRRVFNRAAPLNPVGFKIGLELIAKCGCQKIREIPIHFASRKFGQSKMNLREQINYLKHLKQLADFKHGGIFPLVSFCTVGLAGVVVDIATFGIFLRLGVPLAVARALAIWVAMTWNFLFTRRLAFSYSRSDTVFAQYLGYIASCGAAAAVSWSVSVGSVYMIVYFRHHVFAAAVVGITAASVFKVLFTPLRKLRLQKSTNE